MTNPDQFLEFLLKHPDFIYLQDIPQPYNNWVREQLENILDKEYDFEPFRLLSFCKEGILNNTISLNALEHKEFGDIYNEYIIEKLKNDIKEYDKFIKLQDVIYPVVCFIDNLDEEDYGVYSDLLDLIYDKCQDMLQVIGHKTENLQYG